MLNVVMPIAGGGKRFSEASFKEPKPLIPVEGLPMISRVLENLEIPPDSRLLLICLSSLYDTHKEILERICCLHASDYEIIRITKPTEGAACTILEASDRINKEDELLIANCDQVVLQPNYLKNALDYWSKHKASGGILCFFNDYPQWSYVNMDSRGWVRCVVEKQVVSNFATVGIYHYRHGSDFVRCARRMIEVNDRTNNEFYVAPVYNHFLKENDFVKILPYLVNDMYGLGTPQDLRLYERRPKC